MSPLPGVNNVVGDFETGDFSCWKITKNTGLNLRTVGPGYNSLASTQIEVNILGTEDSFFEQTYTCPLVLTEGLKYMVTAQVKFTEPSCRLTISSSSGTYIWTGNSASAETNIASNVWTAIDGYFIAGASETFSYVVNCDAANTGIFFIDDIVLTAVSSTVYSFSSPSLSTSDRINDPNWDFGSTAWQRTTQSENEYTPPHPTLGWANALVVNFQPLAYFQAVSLTAIQQVFAVQKGQVFKLSMTYQSVNQDVSGFCVLTYDLTSKGGVEYQRVASTEYFPVSTSKITISGVAVAQDSTSIRVKFKILCNGYGNTHNYVNTPPNSMKFDDNHMLPIS